MSPPLPELPSLEQVIGENLRQLREERSWSQDDLARRARDIGLPWSRSSVAAVELGTKTLDLAEVLLLTFVVDRGVADLLAGDLFVRVGRDIEALANLRAALPAGRQASDRRPSAPSPHEVAERAASGEAEQKAARKLGVPAAELSAAAVGLWGRPLTAERDDRVFNWPKPPASRAALAAVRGHITRQLLAELQPILRKD